MKDIQPSESKAGGNEFAASPSSAADSQERAARQTRSEQVKVCVRCGQAKRIRFGSGLCAKCSHEWRTELAAMQ